MSNLLSRKRLVFITVITLMLVTAGLYTSYAINVSVDEGTSTDYDMALNFNLLDSLDMEITVPAGKTKVFDIDIKNSYNDAVKYGVVYSMVTPSTLPDGVTVAQSSNGKNSPMGTVKANSSISVSVTVTNDSASSVTLSFNVINGYKNGGDLIIPEGKIVVSGKLDDSGANVPLLTDGLIPIMYDETRSTWVKADTTNATSPYVWYDYDEKKWANAVLVEDVGESYGAIKEVEQIVNIPGPVPTTYSATYIGTVDDYGKPLIMTFTTGSSGGTLSFDYSSYIDAVFFDELDKGLLITLNGNEILYNFSEDYNCLNVYPTDKGDCSLNGTYSASLDANTSYTLKIEISRFYGGRNCDITISNLSLPDNLSESLFVYNEPFFYEDGFDYYEKPSWSSGNQISVYSDYDLNDDGEFELSFEDKIFVHNLSEEVIGKYMCVDSECNELYQIEEINNNTITKVILILSEYETIDRESLEKSSPGTPIPEDMILAYYVWIPRYKYKVWNKDKVIGMDAYNARTKGIDIVFENGTSTTGDVRCSYNFGISATNTVRNEDCTGTNGESYYTHPAFTFGEDELTGFWMGKFELSSSDSSTDNYGGDNTITLTPRILPNAMSWRKNNLSNFYTVIKNMQVTNNIYGLSTNLNVVDTHMLTNIEWGAVAYLTHSKYGRCTGEQNSSCTEVSINNSGTSSYLILYTGRSSGDPESVDYSEEGTYTYEEVNGQLASTTGNIYGVYDMSGGSSEYVMGNASLQNGSYIYNEVFAGSNYTYGVTTAKYLSTYAYSDTEDTNQIKINKARLGDATGEIAYVLGDDFYPGIGWNEDYAYFPGKNNDVWFLRGGLFNSGTSAGVFEFDGGTGDYEFYASTRAALVVY